MVRRNQHQIGTLFLCLPDRFCRNDPVFFRMVVFRQNDSVTAFRISADSHRLILQMRKLKQFHRGIKSIHITM